MDKSRDNLSPSCSSSEELVAYLYSEMSAAGQSAFEDHLAGCELCTAEFAELSLARLGVYEWHRDEFVELATPRIVVPYAEAVKVSWIDSVRAFLASHAQWATAGGAFAAVALAAGIWLVAPKGDELAKSEPTFTPIAASSPEVKKDLPVKVLQGDGSAQPGPANDQQQPKAEVVKTGARDNARITRPRPVKAVKSDPQPTRTSRPGSAPRLNDFDDEDDNTLRLGDLLAEVDTRDK